jgi:hypothetical protein
MAGIDSTLRWINFRQTNAFVTNGSNQVDWSNEGLSKHYYGDGGNSGLAINGTTYTCGWVLGGGLSDVATRDRTTSGDVRLAGMHFVAQNGAGFADFRLDLTSAGTYEIHVAIGDTADHANNYVAIYDNATLKTTVIDSASNHVADNFYDATGANLSRANWPSSEAGTTVVFASTTLKIRVGKAAYGSEAVCLAALGIKKIVTGGFLTQNYWWGNQ